MAAVSLDQAGPFAELGEAGLEVGLEGEEGWEGVGFGVGERVNGERLHRSHPICRLSYLRWSTFDIFRIYE